MNISQSNFTQELSQQSPQQHFLGQALVNLQVRLQKIQVKVTSLTKIVKLLQHYSEKKDLQYEKETHNVDLLQQKLGKIDVIQKQLNSTLQKYDELTKKCYSHSLKIDQILNKNIDIDNAIQAYEHKLKEQTLNTNRRLQGIESTMLKDIREGTYQLEYTKANNNNYVMQELNFRIQELETQFNNQYSRLKSKIDKIYPHNHKRNKDDDYGLRNEPRKISIAKNKNIQSSMKRMKSK